MSKIRRKDTKPERMFRKALHGKGIRYRVDFSGLPGRPDISNISKNFVVFIDGEFWHGYNWEEKKRKLKSNRGFWIPKIERNMQKDYEVNMALENLGFKVFRFWDHQIKKDLDKCVQEVVKFISNS